jgi:O-antigen/teichoic acid export membrane protein
MKFKLARDFLLLSAGQLASKIIGFVAFAYLARSLGPESYGIVEYVVGLAVVAAMVVDWGMGPIGVRELAARPDRLNALAGLIPAARLAIACVAIPVLGLAAAWSGQPDATVKLIWLYALSLLAIPWKQDWLLQGREMMGAVAMAQLIRMSAFAGGVLVLVHSDRDLLYVGIAELAAVAVMVLYYLGVQRARICPLGLVFSFKDIRKLIREGASVGLSNMVWAFIQYVPLFLVAHMVGGLALAWFAAAHRIVTSLLTFSWIYHWNLYPTIARRAGTRAEDLALLLQASCRVIAWGGILAALILTVLAEPLVVLGFGQAFAAAGPALAIFIWVLPVTLLSGHARWVLVAKGRQHRVLAANLTGAAVVVLLGLILTPKLEAIGASIAMLGGTVTIWAVSHFYAVRQVPALPALGPVVRPAGGTIIGLLLAWWLYATPWLGAAAAAATYVVFALASDRRLVPDLLALMHAKAEVKARPTT